MTEVVRIADTGLINSVWAESGKLETVATTDTNGQNAAKGGHCEGPLSGNENSSSILRTNPLPDRPAY